MLIQKIIEHFILVLLEPYCPRIAVIDNGLRHDVNRQFEQDYKTTASLNTFEVNGFEFRVHGFRLPTSRMTKHKLVYAADQRAVQSDSLEDYVPNLRSRLEDNNGRAFFYLAIVQSPYLSQHVSLNRSDFDFSVAGDGDVDDDLLEGEQLIPKAAIRDKVIECVQADLKDIIENINSAKLNRVRQYVVQEAPQYRILLKSAHQILDRLSPLPSRGEIEAVLHRELCNRETELKRQSTRIVREAEKIEDYEEYSRKFTKFLDEYN